MGVTDQGDGPRPSIRITQELLDRATPSDSGHCAIADAIKEQVPGASAVSVDLATIRWTDRAKGERYIFLTPEKAQRLLLCFDQGLPIPAQKINFRRPAQIVRIRTSRDRAAASAARRDALLVKEAAGEELTGAERRSLTAYRKHESVMGSSRIEDRPAVTGPKTTHRVSQDDEGIQVRGGNAPQLGVLAHGRGQRRRFGVRVAGVPDPYST